MSVKRYNPIQASKDQVLLGTAFIELQGRAAPAAPADGNTRIYCVAADKDVATAIFATGAGVAMATEV